MSAEPWTPPGRDFTTERHIVPAQGGHARIGVTLYGEAVSVDLFGPKGGFRAGLTFDTVGYAPQLVHTIETVYEEAVRVWDLQPTSSAFDGEWSRVAELGYH